MQEIWQEQFSNMIMAEKQAQDIIDKLLPDEPEGMRGRLRFFSRLNPRYLSVGSVVTLFFVAYGTMVGAVVAPELTKHAIEPATVAFAGGLYGLAAGASVNILAGFDHYFGKGNPGSDS